ncbi:MAG: MotA/TolQ/ExbB proton channel family protein [Kiritimatiellae bacterium]|nr:MotA/TolQ/ExbB proton channel family protein [Kiritimatiellia bacterium]
MKKIIVKMLAVMTVGLVMLGAEPLLPSDADCGRDFFVASALAQAPAAAGGEAAPAGPPTTLGDYWVVCGLTRWPLLAVAIWITALIIELTMRARTKALCPPAAVSQLSSTLAVQDYVKAWQFCADNPSPLARIMMPVIEALPKGLNAVMDTAFDNLNLLNNTFKTKCSYLNLHATVSTLLGLFGTISGMMSAFNKMAYSGATGDPAKLAGSISEALVTTYVGLALAISALVLFYVFTNRIKAVMTDAQNTVLGLIGEIDFSAITSDMEIVTGEMKARAMGGKIEGGSAPKSAVKPVASAVAAKPAEMAQCPHCQHQVHVGAAKCPNCSSELEWE